MIDEENIGLLIMKDVYDLVKKFKAFSLNLSNDSTFVFKLTILSNPLLGSFINEIFLKDFSIDSFSRIGSKISIVFNK